MGDPFSGKTCLARVLSGLPFATHYEPSVGTDVYPSEDVTICDCSGRERFVSAPTDTTVVCVLVIDGVEGRIESLSGWHDEFLQFFGVRSQFVVAVTKRDVQSRSLALAEVSLWCGDAIPFVEVSAATGDGIEELCACIAKAAEEAEVACEFSQTAEVGECVLGWFDGNTSLWDVAVDDTGSTVRIPSEPPMLATTDRQEMRGASIVCLCVRSHDAIGKDLIAAMQSAAMEASGAKDMASIAWCIVCNSADLSPDATYKVASLCTRLAVGLFFLSKEDTEERVADFWGKIQSYHVQVRSELQLDRLPTTTQSCANIGCPWHGASSDAFRHERTCGHKVVKCRFDGCEAAFPLNGRVEHEKGCEKRPMTCPYCGLSFTGTLNDHSEHCPKQHAYKAEYTRCPLSTFGCHSEPLPRSDLNTHLNTDHMRIAANALNYLSDENAELRTKCQRLEREAAEERRLRSELAEQVASLRAAVEKLERRL